MRGNWKKKLENNSILRIYTNVKYFIFLFWNNVWDFKYKIVGLATFRCNTDGHTIILHFDACKFGVHNFM